MTKLIDGVGVPSHISDIRLLKVKNISFGAIWIFSKATVLP